MSDDDSGPDHSGDGAPRTGTEILLATDERTVDRRLRNVAHGIAHGMNNVLATVMGLASVLESEVEPGSAIGEDVSNILAASRRGLDLTKGLLTLAEGGPPMLVPLSLNEVVSSVASFLRASLPMTVQVEEKLESRADSVAADITQLKHALISLALDATDAMVTAGTLRFTTRDVVLDGGALEGERWEPGNYVRLRVEVADASEDGPALAGTLGPLFRKSGFEAVGLGLPLVRDTVRAHGGRVLVDAEKGTIVDLPAIAHSVASSQPPSQEELSRGGLVLLVDDEPLVLRSSQRLLERLGFDVRCASGGEEALTMYRRDAEQISFVLLDLVMPEMDGREVLEQLIRIDSEVRVIICTGYGVEPIANLLDAGACASIQKPYTLRQLRRVFALTS